MWLVGVVSGRQVKQWEWVESMGVVSRRWVWVESMSVAIVLASINAQNFNKI